MLVLTVRVATIGMEQTYPGQVLGLLLFAEKDEGKSSHGGSDRDDQGEDRDSPAANVASLTSRQHLDLFLAGKPRFLGPTGGSSVGGAVVGVALARR